ncbi:hypothetical protein [Acetivibrio cellulolyticus]|uniref:hypothetical protein n=1 Tax=Acetivibrio cellulolyticus TaxID=35830 RepID=UPI0001E2D14B|nr:hypothetical protein [Acetivibrio cellulolyticus]
MKIKKVLKIIILTAIFVISIYVFIPWVFINDISTKEADIGINNTISGGLKTAISSYIVDTEDYDLTFDGKSTKSVGDIIFNLDKLDYIDLESYEPSKHRIFGLFKVDNLGWRIIVNKETCDVDVLVSEKDELIFTE